MSKLFNIHDWQAKQHLAEHHGDDFPKSLLSKSVNDFLEELKKKSEADYDG